MGQLRMITIVVKYILCPNKFNLPFLVENADYTLMILTILDSQNCGQLLKRQKTRWASMSL